MSSQSPIPGDLSAVGFLYIFRYVVIFILISIKFINKDTAGPIGKAAENKLIYPKSMTVLNKNSNFYLHKIINHKIIITI